MVHFAAEEAMLQKIINDLPNSAELVSGKLEI